MIFREVQALVQVLANEDTMERSKLQGVDPNLFRLISFQS